MKNIRIFSLKIFIFLVVKFSVYLNRRVFVMDLCFSLNFLQRFNETSLNPDFAWRFVFKVQTAIGRPVTIL